ncbi:hypothetical protein TI39_contig4215g00008 [Zymoseptoria brevis]|uniref:Uncharacterized protein n=1 Tax=Zymoseptoria brevis TaxID=1047168 RepID=A0A0F4GD67_9PEZI|nr:hypothetical protein TI39_contig4215g00008 [Zymoseptoria brevis]
MFFNKVLAPGAAFVAVANGLAPPPNGPNAAPKGSSPPPHGHMSSKNNGWPNFPCVTKRRDMGNSKGETVTFAGINWSGKSGVDLRHGEAMIPEGLQYQSIKTIVQKVKDLDMNVIRLTYAIQMIDDIVNGNESSLRHSFISVLGPESGTVVLANVLKNDPQFKETTTRLK